MDRQTFPYSNMLWEFESPDQLLSVIYKDPMIQTCVQNSLST